MNRRFFRRPETKDYTQDKPACCRTCPYFEHPMVENEGPDRVDLFLVGDSPWKTEEETGRPFQGPAGAVLDALLENSDIDRNDIFVANAVKCRPDKLGEAYPPGVVETCVKNFLLKDLQTRKPKLVVPMGNTAMSAFTGAKGITKARGVVQQMKWEGFELNILPTFHPSYLNKNPAYIDYAAQDFHAVKYYIQHGSMPPENVDLDYRPVMLTKHFNDFFALVERTNVFSWDLETTGLDWRTDEILCMSFSFKPRTAHVVMLYEFPVKKTPVRIQAFWHKDIIRRFYDILHSGKTILFHNGKFDLRMLHQFFKRHAGLTLHIEKINWYDTRAMYGLIDENTKQSLKEVSKLHTDLRYGAEELKVVKGGQLKRLSLEKVVHYAGKDADATRRIGLKFRRILLERNLWPVLKGHDYSDMEIANNLFDSEIFGAPIDKDALLKLEVFLGQKIEFFRQRMIKVANRELQRSYGNDTLLTDEFNPRSSDQLRVLLFDQLDYPPPEKRTGTGKYSTDKEVINKLIEDHPDDQFMKVLKLHRDYDSIYKTFAKGFLKKLGDDNRLHPDFAFTSTVSGRVVCYNPNLANIPRDKELEPGVFVSIRSLFVARQGWRIGYTDFNQIEFKCAAILSGDAKMIRALFVNHDDFHALVARGLYPGFGKAEAEFKEADEYLKNLQQHKMDTKLARSILEEEYTKRQLDSFKFDELFKRLEAYLAERCKSREIILKTARTRAKNFNFGRIYGGQRATLAKALGLAPDDPRVDEFIDRLAATYPDFEAYLAEIPEMAIREGQLISPYGRVRHFPFSLDSRVQSEQGRQGGNFGPQSSAAYAMRAAFSRIAWKLKELKLRTRQFNIVYDSNINEHPIDEEKTVARIVAIEMLKPVPELNNAVFSMEMGNGISWKEAEHNAVKLYDLADAKKYVASL